MSFANFIPELWIAQLAVPLEKQLVYGSTMVSNRDYEGQIATAGDTVRVSTISDPTIIDYTPNVTVLTPENLSTGQRTLTITESKAFVFEIDDVDARQVAGDLMPQAMRRAAYKLADIRDQFLASKYAEVPAGNQLGTIGVAVGSPTAAYDSILVPLKVTLDEADVPTEGRYCIIPPWLHGRFLRDDRFIKVGDSGTTEGLRNGFVGRAAGFNIMVSNNTPNPTADHNVVQAGVPEGLTFAGQINKVEAFRPENAFSDAIKGLDLYGGKLLFPDRVATAIADPTP